MFIPFWPSWAQLILTFGFCCLFILMTDSLQWYLYLKGSIHSPYLNPLITDITYFVPIFSILGYFIDKFENLNFENHQIHAKARVAQSIALRGQLHPHALFNGLSGLAELIHKDPVAAEASVHHLSTFLRRVLLSSEIDRVPLKDERSLLTDYLDMEALRLGPRLSVQWDWDESLNFMDVPPLLLHPLVENAVKYGIAPNPEGGRLILGAKKTDSHLELSVQNSGCPYTLGAVRGTGLGLRNLRARLQLVYGSKAGFQIGTEGGLTVARIRVPLAAPGPGASGPSGTEADVDLRSMGPGPIQDLSPSTPPTPPEASW
jgi:sensor histidine kinase YesM